MTPPSWLETLLELGQLEHLPRTGYALRGIARPESVAGHSFHTALVALVLAPLVGLDPARCAALALLHDAAEVRLGDIPRPGARHLPPGVKQEAEAAIARSLFGAMPRVAELWKEAHEPSKEADLIAFADAFQLRLRVLAYERAGVRGLEDFWRGRSWITRAAEPLREAAAALLALRASEIGDLPQEKDLDGGVEHDEE